MSDDALAEASQIVAAFEDADESARRVPLGDPAELPGHPGEAVGRQLESAERVFRGGVKAGGNEHELRLVVLERG